MSKQTRERTAARHVREETPLIPLPYQHLAAVAVIILTLVVYFAPVVFGGKTFLAPDNIASHSWDTLLEDAKKEGVFPLWNPYIFCGMPGYASLTFGGDRAFDISALVFARATTLFSYALGGQSVAWVVFFYIVFALGMYLFTASKVNSKVAALVGSLGAAFSMYIIIWIMTGHNTKIAVMMFFPYILFVLERLRTKADWKLALLLILLIHFSFLPSHVQMIFYSFLAYGVYLLFFFVREVMTKGDWKGVVRTGAILVAASALAFAMDADKYLSVWEYNPYSMRGSAPVVPTMQKGEIKTKAGGLDYDYATNWSLGVGEVATFFVPSWYGFGSYTYSGPEFGGPQQLNTYFGPQPFTDGPQYMGVVVLVLAVIGFWRNRKEPFVQYLGLMIGFSLLVAFGREFSLVYDLLFNYLPGFNKFRIPSMILVLVQIFVPVLAAYGVASMLQRPETMTAAASLTSVWRVEKRRKYILGALVALVVVSFAGAGVVKEIHASWVGERDAMSNLAARGYGNNPQVLTLLFQIVQNRVVGETQLAASLLLVTFAAAYFYAKQRISLNVFAALVVAVVVYDLWHVNRNPFDPKPQTEQNEIFNAPDYVRYLQKDSGLFRTLLLKDGQPPYDNTLAYWRIQSAYGYQGAKMRAYQDLVDVAGLGNPLVWQLMNVKYIISNRIDTSGVLDEVFRGQMLVYKPKSFVPRAFFVNRYETVGGLDMLQRMRAMAFDPTDVAYVLEDSKLAIDPPLPGVKAEYVRYGVQSFELNVTATGNNLLFLSEAYYPHGWKAYLDGNEIPIYRLDYLFRGVVVPKGEHTVAMKFEPRSFAFGKNVSLAANILVLSSIGAFGFVWWRKRNRGSHKNG
ncbi:MAG: YfhO family protein [Ignavibacteriales bacterium]|nr:YfhO family protein [Ignavibacteriales bacterium]